MTVHTLLPGDLTVDMPESEGPFDEQLCLTCDNASVTPGVKYVAHLADGSTQEGEIDQQGRTQRIVTQESVQITQLELIPPQDAGASCCSMKGPDEPLVVDLTANPVFTNSVDVGASIQTVPLPEGDERALTAGEIAMARRVFQDAIDYSRVKVHHGGWWLFLGLQNTAVTPNG
ncbi:type VI secretion system tip protein VgrG, partial [Pseudomonas citronellolis]|nr:type VI secretion system tip protein VgrG [Pseudomonas citronellolis]